MSLSNPTTENPVKKFIEYKAEESTFQYWDKKQEKNIPLELPVQFIVLDELATITGYCEVAKSNLYSNEVHNLNLQMLNVKSFKGGVHLMGKYADIKDEVKSYGGKFTKSVYAALFSEGGLELVNFKLKGDAFSKWLDKKINVLENGIEIKSFTDEKKGKNEWKAPVYEPLEITGEYLEEATAMDVKLQEFLVAYESKQIEKPVGDIEDEDREEVKKEFDEKISGEVRKMNKELKTDDDLPF